MVCGSKRRQGDYLLSPTGNPSSSAYGISMVFSKACEMMERPEPAMIAILGVVFWRALLWEEWEVILSWMWDAVSWACV